MSKAADAEGEPSPAPTTAASAPVAGSLTPVETAGYDEAEYKDRKGSIEVYLPNYLGYLCQSEGDLAEGYRKVGEAHARETEVYYLAHTLAGWCEAHAEKFKPFVNSYGEQKPEGPEQIYH